MANPVPMPPDATKKVLISSRCRLSFRVWHCIKATAGNWTREDEKDFHLCLIPCAFPYKTRRRKLNGEKFPLFSDQLLFSFAPSLFCKSGCSPSLLFLLLLQRFTPPLYYCQCLGVARESETRKSTRGRKEKVRRRALSC